MIKRICRGMVIFSCLMLHLNYSFSQTDIHTLYSDCKLEGQLSFEIFKKAIIGYNKIPGIKKRNVISIIDFTQASTSKRFFVIDLQNKKLLYACLVAHGRNSGDNMAKSFSNKPKSLKSSLGFYLTAETYIGKHGYSLKLDGLEKNINDKAREREIVIHGAEYVSEKFAKLQGRIGRSWGCPALPKDLAKEIIDVISKGSCLFIYAEDVFYNENTNYK